jgi:hypothetical protein
VPLELDVTIALHDYRDGPTVTITVDPTDSDGGTRHGSISAESAVVSESAAIVGAASLSGQTVHWQVV